MRKLLKIATAVTVTLVVLLVIANSEIGRSHVTHFTRPIRGSQRQLHSIGALNLNSDFDMALFRGISQIQVEQAMADRRLPPLRPDIKSPAEFTGPSKSILVFSTWRTGSSFLGDLIASNPGVFYSFEPLHIIDPDSHISTSPKVQESLNLMNLLLKCQFPQDYLTHINGGVNNHSSPVFMSNNRRIWDSCLDKSFCNRTDFVRNLCVNFPVHLIKTVRLRLAESEKLIDNQESKGSVKVILLVRDPRAIMASRKDLNWCTSPSCADAKMLCTDMYEDLNALNVLQKKHPETYLLVKHEELSFHPDKTARDVMKFVGLKYSTLAQVFIKTHTKSLGQANVKDPYSTVRKSSEVPNEWKKKLSVKEIVDIEKRCSRVMNSLDYEPLFMKSE